MLSLHAAALGYRARVLLHLIPDDAPDADRAHDTPARDLAPIVPALGTPFVHLCREDQLDAVRVRHFPGRALWAHAIDPAHLDPAALREEDSYGHGAYPHYYGAIPAAARAGRRLVDAVTPEDVARAEPIVRRAFPPTPLLEAPRLSARVGAEVWIKLESTTPIRAFKIRGALVKLEAIPQARGVITASAGNHGLAVAWAARAHGKPATVIVPEGANPQKVAAMRAIGARVEAHGADYQAAHEHSLVRAAEHDLVPVHAYDDPWIIAGQGTVARELPPCDTLIASIGGGGLIAGLSVAWKGARPSGEGATAQPRRLYGVEPTGADAMARSFEAGRLVTLDRVTTIADGLGARRPSPLTLRLARAGVDEVVRVEDADLKEAMRVLLEEERLVSEPAGAACVAALLVRPSLAVGRTVVVLSGANVSDALFAETRAPRAHSE